MFNQLEEHQHPDRYDVAWMKGQIKGLPSRLRSKLQHQFYTDAVHMPVRERNTRLRKAAERTHKKVSPLFLQLKQFTFGYKAIATKDAVRKTAARIAADMFAKLLELAEANQGDYADTLELCYLQLCEYALQQVPEVSPPFFGDETPEPEFMEVALLKLKCDRWWCRKLLGVRKRYLETLEIVAGNVGRKSPYASKQAVAEWARDQQATQEWAKANEMINQSGQVISLEAALAAGMGDPENMRSELMKRISGLEDYAEEMKLQGLFFTLTAPSKYHSKAANWNGATPKQTQKYLVKTWGRARSAINRLEIKYFGVRVAEPHKDSCPHWHMMIWCNPADARVIAHIIRKYFCAEDKHELTERFKNRKALRQKYRQRMAIYMYYKRKGKKVKAPAKDYYPSSPRFIVEKIVTTPRDKDGKRQGGAAAYIAKYIAKNINAKGVENLICEETGQVVSETIHHVQTWKSVWGIRQFQFQGCDPITIYRELRRIGKSVEAQQIELVRQGAESKEFIDFIKAMKQVDCGLEYEIEPMANQYGEAAKRVKGVVAGPLRLIGVAAKVITRTEQWQLRRKARAGGAADLSWTSGNNCTPSHLGHKFTALGITPQAMKDLERGCTVSIGTEKWRIGRYGQIEPAPHIKYEKPWDAKNPDFTTKAH